LRYDYEVRDAKPYFSDIPNVRIAKDMLKLAEHILEIKAAHFDPKTFKDEYETALRKLVQKKAAGKKIEVEKPEEKPSNVINLMDALRQSIKGADRPRPRRKARRGATRSRRAA
jgi:DNA end-binding protein Ku